MSLLSLPDHFLSSVTPRNLWREVTRYLRLGDIDAATEQKRRLEDKQRMEERKRENLRTPWQPKYFIQEVTSPPVWVLVLRGRWICLANAAVWTDRKMGQERSWEDLG